MEGIIHHLIWASILMYVSFSEGTAGFDVSLQDALQRGRCARKCYFLSKEQWTYILRVSLQNKSVKL